MRGPPYIFIMLVVACAASVLVAGCSDDSPFVPRNNFEPNIDNIWPAKVGSRWIFTLASKEIATSDTLLYPTPYDVPELPSFEDLYAELWEMNPPAGVNDYRGRFFLGFVEDISRGVSSYSVLLEKFSVADSGDPSTPSPLALGQVWNKSDTSIWFSVLNSSNFGNESCFAGPGCGRGAAPWDISGVVDTSGF